VRFPRATRPLDAPAAVPLSTEPQRIGLDHHDLWMKRRGNGPKVLTASLHVLRLGLIEALKRLLV
jgi:hypothetical protein